MNFDSSFTYALDYFDGLMGAFFPTVCMLAEVMALLGVAWGGFQVAFGSMETRKFAVGTIVRFAIFGLCLAFYPPVCRGLRTFAMALGEIGGGETKNSVTVSLDTYIAKLEKESSVLGKIKSGDYNGNTELDETAKTMKKVLYKGSTLTPSENKKIIEKIEEYSNTIKSLDKIMPADSNGKRHLRIELVPKDVSGNTGASKNYREGLMSLDSFFKLSYMTAQIMRDKVFDHDVVRSSLEEQESFGKGNYDDKDKKLAEKLEEAGDYETAYAAAVAVDKIKMTLTSIPFAAVLRYIKVCICSIFVIVLSTICIIQYAMHMVEYSIVTGFSIILIPLALFDGLKDYAMKIITMLFAEGVKLAFLVMMMYYNLGLFGGMCNAVLAQKGKGVGLAEMSFVIFSAIMGFALISNAPKLASTVVTGHPEMSMGEFMGAAAAIGGGVSAGAAAGVMGAKAVGGGASGLYKGVRNGVNAGRDVYAGGGGMAHAIGSGIKNFGMGAANGVLGAFSPRHKEASNHVHHGGGSGSVGNYGASLREKQAQEHAAVRAENSAVQRSAKADQKAMQKVMKETGVSGTAKEVAHNAADRVNNNPGNTLFNKEEDVTNKFI